MGFYVNPAKETKTSFLAREGISVPDIFQLTWESVSQGFLPVVLLLNGTFAAAGIAYCEKELQAFTKLDDHRPRRIFMVKIETLLPVAGDDFRKYVQDHNLL